MNNAFNHKEQPTGGNGWKERKINANDECLNDD